MTRCVDKDGWMDSGRHDTLYKVYIDDCLETFFIPSSRPSTRVLETLTTMTEATRQAAIAEAEAHYEERLAVLRQAPLYNDMTKEERVVALWYNSTISWAGKSVEMSLCRLLTKVD